jgi:outer membrane protein assembly factor BamB
MKKTILFISAIIVLLAYNIPAKAQVLRAKITFEETPLTHNVHIVSDGEYYYTCNGGRAEKGQIQKFSFNGRLLDTYEVLLDMRSIMYNQKDKSFYVCTYEKDIYKITSLERGRFEKVISEMYENEQANLAMSKDGKYIYYFTDGTLKIYKFPSGKLSKTIKGLDCGKEFTTGSGSVACDGKYFYTWNGDYKMIYAYDMKGKKVRSFEIEDGTYGFSLSCANGMVFVADDGNYDVGKWYGYDLWAK